MTIYANQTSVPVERSRAEIEKLLQRYGAEEFVSAWKEDSAMIGFKIAKRHVRFVLPVPSKEEDRFVMREGAYGKKPRKSNQVYRVWEQECRSRWRALALVIKAKLEAVESGIATFEEEFLPHIVLPDGKTVGDHIIPKIMLAYETKKMQPLLPGY